MSKKVTKNMKFIVVLLTVFVLGIMPDRLNAQTAKTYDEAIIMGDKYYNQNKLLDAKAYYQMALKFKKNDKYAKEKISTIVKKLMSKMDNEEKYYEIIDRADEFYDKNALDAALAQYEEALKIIPDDKYAKDKIAEIKRIKKEEKEKQKAFKTAMTNGEKYLSEADYKNALEQFLKARHLYPEKEVLSEKIDSTRALLAQKEINTKKADEEILLAKRYLLIKNYALALEHYKKADSLIPGNAQIALEISKIEPKAKKQSEYNKVSAEADNLYIAKNFMAARKKYLEASKLWPDNTYPQEMIAKIDEQLNEQKKHLEKNYNIAVKNADSLYKLKEFENAKAEYNLALTLKPSESYPKAQIKAIDDYYAEQKRKLEKNYNSVIASADSLFRLKQFEEAEMKYNLALNVKPSDPYPAKQLDAIKKEKKKIAAEKERNLKYNAVIAEADRLFDNGQYDLAIEKYKEAQVVKSIENYPKEKIARIKKILLNLKKQKELDEKYNNQIILATRLVQEEKYDEAKKAFSNALNIKPDASLPKIKMAQIDSLVEVKAEKQRIETAYKKAVKNADSLLNVKNYDAALTAYSEALKLKPQDKYAQKQKQSVAKTIASIEKAKKIQQEYDKTVANADNLLKNKKYELAKVEYQKALGIKSAEQYPRQKINEIDKILVQLEKEKEQRYLQAMSQAQSLFSQKNYTKALLKYQEANSIKPDEKEPLQKIDECNGFIAEQLKKIKAQYDLAIADADKYYAAKIYDRAIKAYKRAAKIKPDETYPGEMIKKITKFIEDNAITDVVKSPVIVKKGETQKFGFNPLPVKVRKSNYLYVKARNTSGKDYKAIFAYGSKNGKNGGFVVPVPADGEIHEFIIRVGNQYKWFSEDNDWVSVFPEGGDLEITLLRISKSN